MSQPLQLTFLDRIVEAIKALAPNPGLDPREVVARDMPSDWTNYAYRGISVIMERTAESAGTNCRDDYGHRFLVVFCAGTSKGSGSEVNRWIPESRDQVRKRFNNRRIDSVPECMICSVTDGEMESRKPWRDAIGVSVLIITCWARESRTG